MPANIANRLYPPVQVLPFDFPPGIFKFMVYLESVNDQMTFLNGDAMLYLGA